MFEISTAQGSGSFWNPRISAAQVLQFALITHAAGLLWLYVIHGKSSMVNFDTVMLTLVLDCILFAALYLSRRENYPHLILLVLVLGVFFLLRILSYLVLPDGLIGIPFEGGFTVDDVNNGLLYLILGSVFIIGGFETATWSWSKIVGKSFREENRTVVFSPLVLVIVWVVILAVEWYFMIWTGASVFDLSRNLVPGLWLIHLFSSDTVALVTLVMVLTHKRLFWKYRYLIMLLMVAYLVTGVLEGARGGIVRVGWFLLCFLLAYAGNFRALGRQYVSVCMLIIVGSVAVYPVGTGTRYMRAGASDVVRVVEVNCQDLGF